MKKLKKKKIKKEYKNNERKLFIDKHKFHKKKNCFRCKLLYFFSILFIISLFILIIIIKMLSKPFNNKIKIVSQKEILLNEISNKDKYFACFSTMIKQENRYVREVIDYYLKLGVEKFILTDNSDPNTEKLSDVLQDYIKYNIVDILDYIGKPIAQSKCFEITYERYKTKCEWILFFDIDEYLVMHFNEEKNITLKEYVSNPIFDKCESILINWLLFTDNNLAYYDNRTLLERFTEPSYTSGGNAFIKAMVRGNLSKPTFVEGKTHHHPNKDLIICDSMGEIIKDVQITLKPPRHKYAYLMHFTTKTAEEYVAKTLNGYPENRPETNIPGRVDLFFDFNKFTEEKLKIFEKGFNMTFPKYHKNK